jgi:hypothetical protein
VNAYEVSVLDDLGDRLVQELLHARGVRVASRRRDLPTAVAEIRARIFGDFRNEFSPGRILPPSVNDSSAAVDGSSSRRLRRSRSEYILRYSEIV